MISYQWPGNVRELENVIEYAVNFERSSMITVKSLPQWIVQRCSDERSETSLKSRTAELEADIIRRMMEEMGDSVKAKKAIAEKLGISLTTLYRKLKN